MRNLYPLSSFVYSLICISQFSISAAISSPTSRPSSTAWAQTPLPPPHPREALVTLLAVWYPPQAVPPVDPSSPCWGSVAPCGCGHCLHFSGSPSPTTWSSSEAHLPLLELWHSIQAAPSWVTFLALVWFWHPSLGPGGCSYPDTGAYLFCPKGKVAPFLLLAI